MDEWFVSPAHPSGGKPMSDEVTMVAIVALTFVALTAMQTGLKLMLKRRANGTVETQIDMARKRR
jgi:hypothetical protein